MAIHDITVPFKPGMTVWPGHPPFEMVPVSEIAQGKRSNVSRISMASHNGTHMDPPYHFLADGATLDGICLETLIGPADVLHIPDAVEIDADLLESLDIPEDCQRLLFHTSNSIYWDQDDTEFHADYVGLTTDGAQWIVDRGIKLVGNDYLGVHRYDSAIPVHHVLLGANVVVVEGLNLTNIPSGRYRLIALPMKIAGGDGAPVRAVLVD